MHPVPHGAPSVIEDHDTDDDTVPLSRRLAALVPDDDIWTHAVLEEHAIGRPNASTLARLNERRLELMPALMREGADPAVLAAGWALTAAIGEAWGNTKLLRRAQIWALIDLGVAA